MSTFYSIVSATINPLTDEKISLGLLLSDGSKSRYAFSSNRLSFVKDLVTAQQYRFIRDYLRSFNTIIEKVDKNTGTQTVLESLNENHVISESYIRYMSNYGQNVIQVSDPVKIDLSVEEDLFQKLFVKFVGKQDEVPIRIKKSILQVKDDFTEQVKEYFSVDRELISDEFPGLELPVTIDLFGKNDIYVMTQFVDLEKNIIHIKRDIYDLEHINQIKVEKKLFLVSQEPNKKIFPQQHHFWNQSRQKYQYVGLDEVDSIREYAVEHGVIPV